MFSGVDIGTSAISQSGEVLVLGFTLALWGIKFRREFAARDGRTMHRILWFTFWLGQFAKSVRSDRLVLVGNALLVTSALLLFLSAPSRGTGRSGRVIMYLFCCVLVYMAGTFAWYRSPRTITVFAVSLLVWLAVLWDFNHRETAEFIEDVFSSMPLLLFFHVVLILTFVLCFPSEAFYEIRLYGPFTGNQLPRNLLVILFGIFCMRHTRRALSDVTFAAAWITILLVTLFGLSRAGIVLCLVFLFGNMNALGKARGVLLLVVAGAALALAQVHSAGQLTERFTGGDGGRTEGIRIVLDAGTKEFLFGHGFMKSSVDIFQESTNPRRERGYASHCYYASVFYEYGIVGSILFAALYLTIFYRLYVRRRSAYFYKYAFWLWICFSFSALVENTSWCPVTPFVALVTIVAVLSTERAKYLPAGIAETSMWCGPDNLAMGSGLNAYA